MVEPGCQDCNQLVAEKQDLRDKLRSAYAVIAERQQRLEDDERNMRAARRQLELFMDDGIRERITVALALLDESVESRSGSTSLNSGASNAADGARLSE